MAPKRKRDSDRSVDTPFGRPVDSTVDTPAGRPIGRPVDSTVGRPVNPPVDTRDQEPEADVDSADVDSSDVEVQDGRSANKYYAHYGTSSIKALLENAPAVRIQSKVDYKTKKDFSSTPGTLANYMLWSNRWEAFRTSILKVHADSPVTGEQIERCITSYAKSIVSARGGQPLVLGWASEATKMIVNWAIEHTEGFSKLTTQEDSSMRMTLESLLRENILTRETRYEKNTANFGTSAALVRRYLLSTVLNDSLGPQPSTKLLHVCGIIVLLVATAARTGDLTLSNGYNHQEGAWQFLKYSDVQIQVVPIQQANAAVDDYSLIAELIIRAEKRKKFAKTNGNRSIRLSFDPSASTLYMNPIIWIILLGLKSGALAEKTYQDVIQAALARPNRQVEWAAGDRPLFHQFDTRCVPQYEKPATANTTINAVNKFIRDSGVDLRVTPYAFRRGAAQDVMNLKDAPQHNERHAQQRLGHSHSAVQRGVTKLYAEDQRTDYFKMVDEQQDLLNDPFNPLAQAVDSLAAKKVTAPLQDSTTWESPPEQDLIDDDDELWSAAVGVDVNGAEGVAAAAAPQPGEQDFIDDDEELWSAALGVAVDDGEGIAAAAAPQPGEQDLIDDDEELWSTAFDGIAEEPVQPMIGLLEGDGNNRGSGVPTAHVTQTPKFTEMDISTNILLARPTDPGGCMIEQELSVPGDESKLDELRGPSAFVDTMVGLPDKPWVLGARAAGPVDPQRYPACGNGIYRCLRCFRVYKHPSGHDEVCAATFTAELWDTPTVDSAGVVTWTCKSCGRKLHTFSGVQDHQISCARAAQVPQGYSRHGQGPDATLRCLRCRQTIKYAGTKNHTSSCVKNFDPCTWNIDEAENTYTCLFCGRLLKGYGSVKTHLCATRKNSTSAQGVNGAAKQQVDGANKQQVDGAAEQQVDGANKQQVDGADEEEVGGTDGIRRRCHYCPNSYKRSSKRSLEKHIRSVHPGRQVPADIDSHAKRPFKCPRGCKGRHERFTSEARLALHLRQVHGEGNG